ncbi:MAG: ATP-binding protein [Trichodesmium sp.]
MHSPQQNAYNPSFFIQNLSQKQKNYVNTIKSSGKSLLSLMNDILDLSKLEAGKIELKEEEFILRELVEEILRLFPDTLKAKDVSLNLAIADNLPKQYLGDPDRLKQILINLIGNAVKFTERGSVIITIQEYVREAERPANENEIELSFAIEDTGIGISLADQKQLFQPFSQVETSSTRKFAGTGLGLSICEKLVNLMGGQIGVNSEINQGSTFWFKVPLKFIDSWGRNSLTDEPEAYQPDDTSEGTKKSVDILVVEDNLIHQKVIKYQLEALGYDFEIVGNGVEALEKLQENSYALVLMDCQMPILNGYHTTREIRKNETMQDMIIIGLSAYGMEEERQKGLDAGMNDYLSKPYKLYQLEEMIARWTDRAFVLSEADTP